MRLPCIVDYLAGFVLLWRLDNNIVAVGDEIIQQVVITWLVMAAIQCDVFLV